MSGPKVDTARLRELEKKKLAMAREERKRLAGEIREALLKAKETGIEYGISEYVNELKAILSKLKLGNETLKVSEMAEDAHKLIAKLEAAETAEGQKKREIQSRGDEEQREQLSKVKKKKVVFLKSEENVEPEDEPLITEQDVAEIEEGFREEFESFISEEFMTGKHKDSMLLLEQDVKNVTESGLSPERKLKKLKRLYEDFEKTCAFIREDMKDMRATYEEYLNESFDCGAPAKEIGDFGSVGEIEAEIEKTRETAETNSASEYIKRQIDDVMAAHGYSIIGSDVLKETEADGQILYGVDDSSAISVFVSEENQVTMRVVGIGFDSEISEEENEALFQQQCAFCSMHPQITAELALRGVMLQTKKHLPPDRKFNKKIQTRVKTDVKAKNKALQEQRRKENEKKKRYMV